MSCFFLSCTSLEKRSYSYTLHKTDTLILFISFVELNQIMFIMFFFHLQFESCPASCSRRAYIKITIRDKIINCELPQSTWEAAAREGNEDLMVWNRYIVTN